MKERTKRILTVSGSWLTAVSIALALLAFVTVTAVAATDTGMPAMSDIIPDENGTSAITLPNGGNVDSDVLMPDDSTRAPVTTEPATTTRPATTTARPSTTTAPNSTDTGMLEEEGGSILGAIIAVIVVVAVILVVIALLPRKKR